MTKTKQSTPAHICRLIEYREQLPAYERLCNEASLQAEKMLNQRGLSFASITARVKTFHSICEHLKTHKKSSGQFMTTVKDIAGVRVVVWRPSDRDAIARDIFESFIVHDKPNEARLKRSAHGYSDDKYYCSLKACRGIPVGLTQLVFELQVQTAMMNAWASVEHDIVYKRLCSLTAHTKKRFELLAGVTTLVDDSMNTLTASAALDAKNLSEHCLNALGLKEYLDEVVKIVDMHKQVSPIFNDWADARALVLELKKCGCLHLDHLRQIVTQNALKRCLSAAGRDFLNYSSLVRLILIITRTDRYFKHVLYDAIVLDKTWLRALTTLKIDFRGSAQRAEKPIYVIDRYGIPKPL